MKRMMKEGDHSLAYVGGPRFVNPISYSLPNDVLSICTGVAIMEREAVVSVSFQKNGPHTLHSFFAPVLRSSANRINTFSRIGDAKFKKLTGG